MWARQLVRCPAIDGPVAFSELVGALLQPAWSVDAWLAEVIERHVEDLGHACDVALRHSSGRSALHPDVEDQLGVEVPCPFCEAEVKSHQQFASHLWLIHGIKSKWRYYIGESCQCQACSMRFSTRERAIAHLQRENSGCREFLVRTFRPLTEARADILDALDAQRKREFKCTGIRPAEHRARCRPVAVACDLEPLDVGELPGLRPISIEELCHGRDFGTRPRPSEAQSRLTESFAAHELALSGHSPT